MVDRNVNVVVKALRRVNERVVKQITLDTTANLIETTPVDTGHARANWVPEIGSPSDDEVGTRTNVNAGPQQNGLAKVATQYKLPLGSVFISNNVPYITDLNDGSSQQAPAGFVQAAVLRAVSGVTLPPEIAL